MIGAAWRRSAMVSNSGTTIMSATEPSVDPGAVPVSSSVPRISPVSFISSSTSSRSLASSVWEMMQWRSASGP